MTSVLHPTPTPFGTQFPQASDPTPVQRGSSVSPASSTSTLVEDDYPYSQNTSKMSEPCTDKLNVFDSERTPTASCFPSTVHAPSKPVTAATLLSSLLASVPNVPSTKPTEPQSPTSQPQYIPPTHTLSTHQPALPPKPLPESARRLWLPHFLAGIEPALPLGALKLRALSLVSSCPLSLWTPSEISALAAGFAEYALERGAVETAKDGSNWDSAAPFAVEVFQVIQQRLGLEAATHFTYELLERTVGVWCSTWNPTYPGCILFQNTPHPIPVLKRQMNLCRFIGEMYKAKLVSRVQLAGCLATLMEDIKFVEQIAALRNLIIHAGKPYWIEEKLVALGLVPANPAEAFTPIPREGQVVVDVDGFLRELALKVDGMVEMVSLSEMTASSESVLSAVHQVIAQVLWWKEEIEREMAMAGA